MDKLVESIKQHEGFEPYPYIDALKVDKYKELNKMYSKNIADLKLTVGYGTLMPLSEKEAKVLLIMRLEPMIKQLQEKKPYFKQLPSEVQDVLIEMAYQLGINGLMKFKKMWAFISEYEFMKAGFEGLDSKWSAQTPKRSSELMQRMRDAEV